jgi:hemoglobin
VEQGEIRVAGTGEPRPNVYELAGGMPAFMRLIDDFYDRVVADPYLRHLFPEDMTEPKQNLALFLAQFFGGPATYSQHRGHPRLRMRHLPFRIGQLERDLWLKHMLAAMAAVGIPAAARPEMQRYFEDGSAFMINQVE